MNLIAGFLQQCQKTPHQLAFCEENRHLTYAEFKQEVENLSYFLQQHRCTQQPIAILLERGIDAAIAIYAVLKIGAIYLPLDVKNPTSRLQLILADAQAEFVIGKGETPAWLNLSDNWLNITQTNSMTASPLRTGSHIAPPTENIAAILYTSGSTGTPKGVALSHAAMWNFSNWAVQTFKINPQDKIASLAPFHFDLSVFDLFSSLSSGASVYFVPARLTLSPSRLTAWLAEHEITCWYTVPSLLSFLAFKGGLDVTPLPFLKKLLFAGEVFPTPHLIKLTQWLPDTFLYNLYGPTETNVCCYWQVDRTKLQAEKPIPIGVPACGARLEIAANHELLVQCANNFSGYWQQGKLIPRDISQPYPTGDKVSLNSAGEYCYHGRLDRMLKCSGYRVEPAEIETVLNQIDGVETCAVIGIHDTSSGQRPAVALVLKNQTILADIVRIAREKLAPYMLPCKFKVLATLPVLSNGKTDYLTLHSLFNNHD
jgi:amino acid adenylation domain-containing protein